MTRTFNPAPIDFRALNPGVRWLLILNAGLFFLRIVVNGGLQTGAFDGLFGLVPHRFIAERWVWQPFTYLFLHSGFFHLLFNAFCIWMFGNTIESQWGTREFLKFYFLCGLGAAAASVALEPDSLAPVVGASGAVFGLMVAFAMLYQDAVFYLYFFLPVTARQMVIICGIIELVSAPSGAGSGVARFAHLGGLVTGYLYLRWWWVFKIRAQAWVKGAVPRVQPVLPKKAPRVSEGRKAEPPPASLDDVDRILDKIIAQGLDSLSDEEKAVMKRYSERKH